MKEHARHEQLGLRPATRELLAEIEQATGCPVEIRAERGIHRRGRAIYVVSDPDPSRHLILYDPRHERFLDHLVAHECGHLVRFAAVAPSEKRVATVTNAQQRAAITQLLPDIEQLHARGISEVIVAQVLPIWHGGIVAQIDNTPADIHIERWVRTNFPSLRHVQDASLADQITELHLALSPEIAHHSPRLVWQASNAMNYAFAKTMGELLNRPDFVLPYRAGGPAATIGEELLEMVDRVPDKGLIGDQELSKRFADRLGLAGWMSWRTIDDILADRTRPGYTDRFPH